ncbi:hypothetical protein ABW19_dt0204562 [Dactylella cylindrospora]|nr:hypothetical protein ABW19_dt0204562 [Dactylella cylindrospora]
MSGKWQGHSGQVDNVATDELRTHKDYAIGLICALPKELAAATAMLDEEHPYLSKPLTDENTYTLGSIGKHNVVIACLPMYGTSPATAAATWMVTTFPSIKFVLMVGIGGGIPPKVRLGDVVVSKPCGVYPGVVQWDLGKKKDGHFEQTGSLNNPPTSLLTALAKLEVGIEIHGSKVPEYLEQLKVKHPRLAAKYLKSEKLEDILFRSSYSHVGKPPRVTDEEEDESEEDEDWDEDEGEESCQWCDRTKTVKRKARDTDMKIHFGLIASGNQVIKDAVFRNQLSKKFGDNLLCVEMEAAGLMNQFPCIVIRGICDYADSHKNKDWQEYAAAVAAAFTKELLDYVQPIDVDGENPVRDVIKQGRFNSLLYKGDIIALTLSAYL